MRSDDCTAAWTDWLNDFFFISSGSSTAAQPPFPSSSSSSVATPTPPNPPLQSLLPPSAATHPPITALALTLPATFFFLSARSYAPFLLSKPFHIFFTSLLSGRYSTLLCVSNSDCLQISRILISTGNRRATISVMSVVETHYVCWQNSLKRLFSRTRVKKEAGDWSVCMIFINWIETVGGFKRTVCYLWKTTKPLPSNGNSPIQNIVNCHFKMCFLAFYLCYVHFIASVGRKEPVNSDLLPYCTQISKWSLYTSSCHNILVVYLFY